RVEGVQPDALFAPRFAEFIGGAGFGLAASTSSSGGISGTMNAVNSFANTSGPESMKLFREAQLQANSGVTLLIAPGFTGVFDNANGGAESWLFPSEVITGWSV